MRRSLIAIAILASAVLAGGVALGDDGPIFHRTTPRGSFGRDVPAVLVGVPGGRAWGIESELLPLPDAPSRLTATIEVRDPTVAEAFVRIAYYDRATGRPRQIAIVDAPAVRAGDAAAIAVALDPPPNAVAYRVRVLARLRAPDAISARDAVRAILGPVLPRSGARFTRLLL